MKSGIYTITNLVNEKMYVGYAIDFEDRWGAHKYELRANIHHCHYLQKAWNKYGEDNFLFEILVECEEQFLFSEEHYWAIILNVHNSNYGYNIQPTHPYGKPRHAEETKKKIANATIGNTRNIGRIASPERVRKIREIKQKTMGIPIIVINAQTGEYVCEKPSKGELAVFLGLTRRDVGNICTILKKKRTGRTKSLRGYTFVYKHEYDINENYIIKNCNRYKKDN